MPPGGPSAAVLFGSEFRNCAGAIAGASAKGLYFEFKGGLGDVIHQAAFSDVWDRLDAMAPGDEAVVAVFSGTPSAWELFAFHPKARGILVVQTVVEEPLTEARRREMGLPDRNFSRQRADSPRLPSFFTPEDEAFLSSLPARYVAVASCASGGPLDSRSIPAWAVNQVALACGELDVPAVLVGSRYQHRGLGFNPVVLHEEHAPSPTAIDAVGRLTVPGAVECLRRSVANVVCDSAMAHASWSMRRPTLLVVSEERFLALRAHGADHWRWGFGLPEVETVPAPSVSKEAVSSFLRKLP